MVGGGREVPPSGEAPPATRTDITWPAFVTATTGAVTWGTARWLFHGGPMPVEVAVWLQLAVPMGMGALSGEIAYRRARRRAE